MIKIICIGKIKEDYLKDGINEYLKRLSRYTRIEIIELKDIPLKDNMSEIEEEKAKEEESSLIESRLKDSDYLIALDRMGKELSSIELSKKIDNTLSSVNKDIVFMIGGSLGLSKELINKSDLVISFSKLTFPHQLFRLILLEQIYRSFKIMKNETYHK